MKNDICENKEVSAYANYMSNAEIQHKNSKLISADNLFNLAIEIDNSIKHQRKLVERMNLILEAIRSPEIQQSEELKAEYFAVENFILRVADGFYYRNNIISAIASMGFRELENQLRPASLKETIAGESSALNNLALYLTRAGHQNRHSDHSEHKEEEKEEEKEEKSEELVIFKHAAPELFYALEFLRKHLVTNEYPDGAPQKARFEPVHIKDSKDAQKELNYIEGEITLYHHGHKAANVIFSTAVDSTDNYKFENNK
ncbi:hypothetical protein [Providencia hangzhouensis]|uniref:hypothetical protein n=1 Tax=Providencia hangzhouensis TaxID=3031799 RepID=UPI0034DD5B5E